MSEDDDNTTPEGETGESPEAESPEASATDNGQNEQEDYAAANFQELTDDAESQAAALTAGLDQQDINLGVILDVPVTISVEIGRTLVQIRDLLRYTQGSVIELDRLVSEPLDVLVNNTLIAHGEVVVVDEQFGIRLTDVISPSERVQKLK